MRMRVFERPTTQQFADLRAWLTAQGASANLIRQAIGDTIQGRAIGTIADDLRARLKTLPKRQA